MSYVRRFNDRAAIVAIAVLQIAAETKLEPFDLQHRLEQYLRDEFADIARLIAAERDE